VARHLRWVSWQQRRTRFLPVGDHSFPAEQITVNPVFFSSTDSDLTYQVVLAAKKIAVALAKRVWKFYSDVWKGSAGIYEVMISQAASSAPPAGLNNLIWINRDPSDTEDKPSDEIGCLLEKFVKPRLANEFPLGKWAEIRGSVPYKDSNDIALDYEFEWSPQTGLPRQSAATRVEVLHPLFVGPASAAVDRMCIAHITDIHADIRDDVFEDLAHNLAPPDRWAPDISEVGPTDEKDDRLLGGWEQKTRPTEPLLPKQRWKAFNNKNRRFEEIYKKAKEGCDVLLLTGDLIDYGRGHIGHSDAPLGDLGNYWLDRNWFLFYELLARNDLYGKPVYTNLGNHDWRLNPYAPLNPLFGTTWWYNLTAPELERIHGKGATDLIYSKSWTDWPKALLEFLGAESSAPNSMPGTSMAIVTTTESILWYLLLINPFLDYSVRLPGKYGLLMLDWARTETLLRIHGEAKTPISVEHGHEMTPRSFWYDKDDPVAADSLNMVQLALVDHFSTQNVKAKILGIHAPLIGPTSSWPIDELQKGWVTVHGKRFPIIAMGDSKLSKTAFPAGEQPAHGSIGRFRFWILNQLRDNKVSLVLSGHLHRPAMFVIANPKNAKPDQDLRDGMALCLPGNELNSFWFDHGPPLFVNTTSAGPIGHDVRTAAASEVKVPPGYSEITIENDGRVLEVKEQYGDWSP